MNEAGVGPFSYGSSPVDEDELFPPLFDFAFGLEINNENFNIILFYL